MYSNYIGSNVFFGSLDTQQKILAVWEWKILRRIYGLVKENGV